MSRIGKNPIVVPEKTEVKKQGSTVTVKGEHGELSRTFRDEVSISVEGDSVVLSPTKKSIFARALWGTYASHLQNMIQGVNTPFVKKLIVEGVGYKASTSDNKLQMSLGFSHPVILDIPAGITVTVEKNVITVVGIDRELVGSFTAKIRSRKKPEPYKGKGIRYENEVVRRKEGKKSV